MVLELLHAMVPTPAVVAVLGKRNDPDTALQLEDAEVAARMLKAATATIPIVFVPLLKGSHTDWALVQASLDG